MHIVQRILCHQSRILELETYCRRQNVQDTILDARVPRPPVAPRFRTSCGSDITYPDMTQRLKLRHQVILVTEQNRGQHIIIGSM